MSFKKYYKRILDPVSLIQKGSYFLWGPRLTGKSTLLRLKFPDLNYYDLLNDITFQKLQKDPTILDKENSKNAKVIIDEVQRIPKILNEVHRLIENKNMRFILTGSSTRKLKKPGVNLLGGRASFQRLFPLSYPEIPQFNLLKYLNQGGLPSIYSKKTYKTDLKNYIASYIREEVHKEAFLRRIDSFLEFLELLALSNTEEISYKSFASDCGVSENTIRNYIHLLEDILFINCLDPFTKTIKRKARTRKKIFFFDLGVSNELSQGGLIKEKSKLFGKAFEHFIFNECFAYKHYFNKDEKMTYWRTHAGHEVDLILGDKWAFEIKASSHISSKHLKGLRALKEEGLVKNYAVISHVEKTQTEKDGIKIFPWKTFLKKLWNHEII